MDVDPDAWWWGSDGVALEDSDDGPGRGDVEERVDGRWES